MARARSTAPYSVGCVAMLLAVACGGSSPVRPRAPNDSADPTASARCKVVKSAESPLVTEWPASEKANLEARIAEGGVAVAYNGCEMKVLSQCRVKGGYRFQPTTVSTDTVEILNEDDLYAKLPLGATALEGELQRSGRLAVRTTVSGQFRLSDATPGDVPADGECATATHLVSGLSVGAFKMYAGGAASAGGGVNVLGAGVGAKSSASEVVVREAGDPARCDMSQSGPVNTGCQSPLQLFLWPLPAASVRSAGPMSPALPPGTPRPPRAPVTLPPGAVSANIRSLDAMRTWQVLVDGVLVCQTPCQRAVDPLRPLKLKNEWREVDVSLARYSAGASLDVTVERENPVRYGAGTVLGGVGAAGLLSGAVFWPVFCSKDEFTGEKKSEALCSSAPWLVGGGAVALLGGVLLLVGNDSTTEVHPSHATVDLTPLGVAYRAKNGARGVIGPGFAAGQF